MTEVLSGVQTLARLLLLRHELDERDGLTTATMVSGYPGSPLGTFDMTLDGLGAGVLDKHRIVHRPGLNEELAAATVWGSQMGAVTGYDGVDGVAGAWYGKGPGLDRSGDALKHANSLGAGPNGGAVAFCGDDPAAKSSTLTCDSQYTFSDACIPVLYPGDQQDVLDLGLHAFRMSRYCGAWTGLKIVTAVADGIGTVDLAPGRHSFTDPAAVIDGTPWRHEPQATVGPHAVPGQERLVSDLRLRAAQAYARANGLDRVSGAAPGAGLGIVCAGKTYFDVLDALGGDPAAAGVRVLRLGMTFPLAEETVTEFAATVSELAVIEEKRPFVETQLRAILHEAGARVTVLGKRRLDLQADGELDGRSVAAAITRARPGTSVHYAERITLPLLSSPPVPGRPPGYCSGCPHNRSTVVPDGALTGGGVGCHGIQYFEPRQAHHKSLPPPPMGAEGVPWLGLRPFTATEHVIQNLGDGTLSHSGTLAIRAAVAAGADITFKILYNAAVAMTGGQDVTGLLDVPSLTRALEAEGVAKIAVCAEDPSRYRRGARWRNRPRWGRGVSVHPRDDLAAVQESLRSVRGVTVLIYDQRCAAEARRLRKRGELDTPPRRVVINEAVCEGCGDCGAKSNCLSVLPVATEFGEKRQIHDPSCNRDYTCLEGDCPSFVTLRPRRRGGPGARPAPGRGDNSKKPPAGVLPGPSAAPDQRRHGVYFTGIGGTGVVTASRIIAAAAEAAGLAVGGLDQTGLSQKAGAVVSHLHLARSAADLGGAAVDSADLYMSGDILQAAAAQHLAKIRPDSVVVVDSGVTPTAGMLQGAAAAPPREDLEDAIRQRAGNAVFVDAKRIAERVFGDHLLGNVILVGAALQLGGLPVSAADLDAAAARLGEASREALEWGRWAVHDPEATEAAIGKPPGGGPFEPSQKARAAAGGISVPGNLPRDLRDLVTRRTAQVADYSGARLAARYADLVSRAAARDAGDWALTRAVAEAWFKLLTYKDEYEVARLHLAARYDGFTVTYHLHPPVLRRLGLRKKLPLGWPYAAAFRGLRAMRRVRGTPFDVFGWDRDRRLERSLIAEYETLVAELPYEAAVKVSEAALSIKGYVGIKEAAAATWRAEVSRIREEARSSSAPDPG